MKNSTFDLQDHSLQDNYSQDSSHLQDCSDKSIETLVTGLLQHLEEHKRLSPRKLYIAGVDYLEQYLGLKSEELPSNPQDLIIYNKIFDALYDYFKENCIERNTCNLY